MKNNYLNLLEDLYLKHVDPEKAIPMKKYMKDQFEFLGISSGPRKEIYKNFFKTNGKPSTEKPEAIVRELWHKQEREYQYFGMTLLQKMEKNFDMGILPLYEFIITEKSWWDTVDFIAVNLTGPLLKRNREEIPRITGKWKDSGNMWLQRTALLFQLKYKIDTDKEWLFFLCRELSERQEFFIRKAIGWALREYSKTDPDSVIAFVKSNTISALIEKKTVIIKFIAI